MSQGGGAGWVYSEIIIQYIHSINSKYHYRRIPAHLLAAPAAGFGVLSCVESYVPISELSQLESCVDGGDREGATGDGQCRVPLVRVQPQSLELYVGAPRVVVDLFDASALLEAPDDIGCVLQLVLSGQRQTGYHYGRVRIVTAQDSLRVLLVHFRPPEVIRVEGARHDQLYQENVVR